MIKALIFDFYGVIRSNEYYDWMDRHGLKRGGEFKKVTAKLDKGLSSVDEFFENLSHLSGLPAQNIREEFLANASLNKELLSLILKLKDKYKIALLSNASSSYLREVLDEAGIGKLFDEVIISSEIGYIKPSEEIFEHTLNKLKVNASEAIFIDDNISFCQAAEKLGLKAIAFKDLPSLKTELKQMGIIDN